MHKHFRSLLRFFFFCSSFPCFVFIWTIRKLAVKPPYITWFWKNLLRWKRGDRTQKIQVLLGKKKHIHTKSVSFWIISSCVFPQYHAYLKVSLIIRPEWPHLWFTLQIHMMQFYGSTPRRRRDTRETLGTKPPSASSTHRWARVCPCNESLMDIESRELCHPTETHATHIEWMKT